jgi:hypothetical protein
MVGCFALTGIEFDLTSIAAIPAIMGFSINDKVVVYDRVRENLGLYKSKPLREVIDPLDQRGALPHGGNLGGASSRHRAARALRRPSAEPLRPDAPLWPSAVSADIVWLEALWHALRDEALICS